MTKKNYTGNAASKGMRDTTDHAVTDYLTREPTTAAQERISAANDPARYSKAPKPGSLPENGKGHGKGPQAGTMTVLMGVLKLVYSFYPVHLVVMIVCIILQSLLSTFPSVFLQRAIDVVNQCWQSGDWATAQPQVMHIALSLILLYVCALAAQTIQLQLGAVVTQGTLMKLRDKMFDHMEDLPISYFDRNQRGDIMSYYTNDVDALRQLISQALPNLLTMAVAMISVFFLMIWYSVPLTAVVIVMLAFMGWLTQYMGGKSARFFLKQQQEIARAEGFAEEAMNGQKVVKVFTHEQAMQADFDEVNEALFEAAKAANIYGNTLGPILFNLGNLAYVVVALAGSILLAVGAPNLSISGMALSISIVIPFLNLTKRFAGSIGQVSHQINFVVMGLAGAERIFQMLDAEPETDDGYVTLVRVKKDEDGKLVESDERTGMWAWKHPHEDGTLTYVPMHGEVVMVNTDFGYTPDHLVLHDISLYALPGEKVAFVGATGAGKTTITNLINRFYDIADGKIRYDGININKIKKADLRHSLGIVLQDVNLFTGTVMDNIRYGRLDATDEECIAAAKLAGADSFIERLPEGYDTMLTDNAESLSQGQRQLLSIARAAVADPPVMILDEATSSIDTRTEQIVARGMDKLMEGRTTFVIAHRLSTVRNSDVIIVLDHGRIIERGTHDQLIAAKGTYYQLYTGAFELE